MNENANDQPSSQAAPESVTSTELNERFEALKAEIGIWFPGLLEDLEAGTQFVLVSDSKLKRNLEPNWLRLIGGMTALCHCYGAAILFLYPRNTLTVGDKI